MQQMEVTSPNLRVRYEQDYFSCILGRIKVTYESHIRLVGLNQSTNRV